MAAVTNLQLSPYTSTPWIHHRPDRWPLLCPQVVSFRGRRGGYCRACRSFRSGDGGELEEQGKGSAGKCGNLEDKRVQAREGSRILSFANSLFVRVSGLFPRTEEERVNAVAKLEEVLSAVRFSRNL